jgi:succinyl-CoA synthetase beta subunit
MINELKTSALLNGYRKRPITDVEALIEAMLAFSNMIVSLGERLQEAEINPLFVRPRGLGVVAADGLVVVKDNDR